MRLNQRLFSILFALAMACTESALYLPETPPPGALGDHPNKVVGSFCTEDPQSLKFPLKVWFVIDDSGSMQTNDPNQRRYTATKELATKLAKPQEVFFGGQIFGVHTLRFSEPRFTDDLSTFHAAVDGVTGPGLGGTPYLAALALATAELTADIEASESASRTRYVVIFLSDGSPTDAPGNPDRVLSAVDGLMALQPRVGGLTMNTVFLGNTSGTGPADLLQKMAERGNGSFKSFAQGDQLDYSGFDFSSIRRTYNLRTFAVINHNMLPVEEGQRVDSDGDGLSDETERRLGTDVRLPDTDRDGCSDLMEVRVAWDPLVDGRRNGQCSCQRELMEKDTDGDGLNDCEESWLGTSIKDPDSDTNASRGPAGDLIPDRLDFLYLADATFPNDSSDRDRDGVSDRTEFEQHTDVTFNDTSTREAWAYAYADFATQASNERCHHFVVNNVALGKTLATADHAENENIIEIYFAQSPQDAPHSERLFRIARMKVPYAEGGQTITVKPEDFSILLTSKQEQKEVQP